MTEPTADDLVKKTDGKRIGSGKPGPGRPRGVPNKTTLAMKAAISSVYEKLQNKSGGDHAHFEQWAEENPTEFYRIAAKLIPVDLNANVQGQIGMPDIKLGIAPE